MLIVFVVALFVLVAALVFTLLLPGIILHLAGYFSHHLATMNETVFTGLFVIITAAVSILITVALFVGPFYLIRRFNEWRSWRSYQSGKSEKLEGAAKSSSPSARIEHR